MAGREHWLAAERRRQECNDREGMRAMTAIAVTMVVGATVCWPAAIALWLAVWPR